MDMEATIEVVHEKVGRNLLLFQRLEYTLKVIVAMSEISGYASEIEKNKMRRKAWAMRLTLGQIVGEHIESYNSGDEQRSGPSPDRKEPYMSLRHSVECTEAFLEERKATLSGFVKERNELVHHLPTNYDLKSEEDRLRVVEMLDDQHSRLKNEVALTFEFGKNQHEIHKELVAFFQSEEGEMFLKKALVGEKQ